ncbi:hypothetical protein [Lysinibacillus sp. fls2-241-R2A-57]|uniref:hypothetical protein n=1 Tax=Lysinibacillus sp. fls2-241-R2A-57 TaxID=3040292 RepID=UPI002556F15B|nr:hypothetical protein [Lysinibacillus sp. fls2-241-R2A-57]
MKVDVDIFRKLCDNFKKLVDKSKKLVDKQSKVLDKSQNNSSLKVKHSKREIETASISLLSASCIQALFILELITKSRDDIC